jgi:hypothetical protein
MTTFAITVTLSDKEIWALVQALEHHAAVHYEWLLKKFGGRERSIDGILHLCSVILRLRELTVYSPMDPMVFSDDEVRMVGKAIDDYTAVCEREGSNECLACECPYGELPPVLAAILPRLEYAYGGWTQTSGFIPGDEASGKPSTIWLKE